MTLLRIPWIVLRLTWPYLLNPWQSPLLRWRMETYGCLDSRGRLLHAEAIGPAQFFRFLGRHARALLRFVRWAAIL